MSISPEAGGPGDPLQQQALSLLRGRANPFDSLVRPQRPDDNFLDIHEPSVHQSEYEKLLAAIDTYRLEMYRSASDLPDSRVITVTGPRGAGKTHLLESLAYRADQQRQLLIRPTYFEPRVPFEEALLSHFVNALLAPDPYQGKPPFQDLAVQLTARLFRQCLAALNPVERLHLTAPAGWRHWPLLWGGGGHWAGRVEQLIADLRRVGQAADLVATVRAHGIALKALIALAEDHLHRWEKGDDALHAIRRQLYQALIRGVLRNESDALGQFLEEDFAPVGARPFHRGEIVRQLLHALLEMCVLVRLPAVFVYDNLEGLLAPQGQLAADRSRAFLDGLAQAVDATRGLLFVVFAESELHRELRKQANPFVLSRLDQGVPVPQYGLVDLVEIGALSPEALRNLIWRRVGRQLKGFPNAQQLPRAFPFSEAHLEKVDRMTGVPLRSKLQMVRDEYARIIYQRTPPPPPPPPDHKLVLDRVWQEQLQSAARRLKDQSLTALVQDFHAGLRQFVQAANPVEQAGRRLVGAHHAMTKDGHNVHARVTVLDWQPTAAGGNGATGPVLRIAVGFLLAKGNVMPRDVEAKCAPLADTTQQADGLILLWPSPANRQLPAATAQMWLGSQPKHAVLHHLADDDLQKLLAAAGWFQVVREQTPTALENFLKEFLAQRLLPLLPLLVPPETLRSPTRAN